MRRRRFIQAALITTALPAATGGSQRLYGTPASLAPGGGEAAKKFLLPLAKTGLPASTWGEFSSVLQVIENVVGSPAKSGIFFKDPRTYLRSHGLDASDKTLVDDSVIMLTCLADPAVQQSIRKSDYEATLRYFETAGLFEPRDPSLLEKRIEAVIQENMSEIRGMVSNSAGKLRPDQESILLEFLKTSDATLSEDDFAIVAQLVSSGVVAPQACSAVAVCAAAVVVAIVAIAAAYVSVTVGATVALMAGVTVSVVVHLAVKASGGGGCNSCHQKALTSDDAPLQAPFTGTMAKLDPALIRNSERAMRLAKIMNSPGLQTQVIKDVIRTEISAFMKAMKNSGLLPVNDEHLALATEATTVYTYRVIGF